MCALEYIVRKLLKALYSLTIMDSKHNVRFLSPEDSL